MVKASKESPLPPSGLSQSFQTLPRPPQLTQVLLQIISLAKLLAVWASLSRDLHYIRSSSISSTTLSCNEYCSLPSEAFSKLQGRSPVSAQKLLLPFHKKSTFLCHGQVLFLSLFNGNLMQILVFTQVPCSLKKNLSLHMPLQL